MQLPFNSNLMWLLIFLLYIQLVAAKFVAFDYEYPDELELRNRRNTWWSKRVRMDEGQGGSHDSAPSCREPIVAISCYVKKCVFELMECMHKSCDNMESCRLDHLSCTRICFNNNESLMLSIKDFL